LGFSDFLLDFEQFLQYNMSELSPHISLRHQINANM
jgi:hypothetical protein